MGYTTKQFIDSKQFPQIQLVCGGDYLDKKITGIRIIEIPDMPKFLGGGELLLTSLMVYKDCSLEEFDDYLQDYTSKDLSGIILKKHAADKDLELKYRVLQKYCFRNKIPLLEMPEDLDFWTVIKHVMNCVFNKDTARLKYFKLTHDNFNILSFKKEETKNQLKEVLDLLSEMLGNPVALYYSNGNCGISTEEKKDRLVLLDNLEKYTPDILTRLSYYRQQGKYIQYLVKIDILGEAEVYFVITEKYRKLSTLDYMAIENATVTLMHGFVSEFAQQEIEKKYNHDIIHGLLTRSLNEKEMASAIKLLGLDEEQEYQIIVFQTQMDNYSKYDKKFLREVGVLEGELVTLLPDQMIFRNMERIVALYKVRESQTQMEVQKEMEELQETLKKSMQHRRSEGHLRIGKVVKGVANLADSYKEAEKALRYIDIIRIVSGDTNRNVFRYSNLGFFQILGDIENPKKLLQYIPESVQRLHDIDEKGELMQTLQIFLDNNQSLKKTSQIMFVHYRTVVYRINKISELTGMDFKNSNEMLAVRVGLIIYKIIDDLK